MTKEAAILGRIMYPEAGSLRRPRTRADCASVPRPCPYVGCEYNMYLDVTGDGSIKFNYPGIEPGAMEHSCVLDVVDNCGEITLEEVGDIMNLTRERIRQIQDRILEQLEQNEVARKHK